MGVRWGVQAWAAAATVGAALGGLVGLTGARMFEAESLRGVIALEEAQHTQLLATIINLQSEGPRSFAFDYSHWDDMVKFAGAAEVDTEWATENIAASMPTFKADAGLASGPR